MRRRLELKGSRNGARIYDDYAHHPTEVRAALSALRELGPERLIAVFQPHLYSRTKALPRSSAPPWPWPTRSPCSTSTRPARSRSASWPGSAACRSPGRGRADAGGGRSGGCRRPRPPRAALAPRLGSVATILVTIGAGDVFKLGEAAGRGGRAMSAPPPGVQARLPARPPDDGPHRRRRRLVRPAGSAGELLELLAWAGRRAWR